MPLALYRRINESFVVDLRTVNLAELSEADRILSFKIIEIIGDQHPRVRILCFAAKQVPIHRLEVFTDIQQMGREHQPSDLMNAAPQLLEIVQGLDKDLRSMPTLNKRGRELLDRVTAVLRLVEPEKFDGNAA